MFKIAQKNMFVFKYICIPTSYYGAYDYIKAFVIDFIYIVFIDRSIVVKIYF